MLFTVILLLGIHLVFGCCPDHWIKHKESCYAFIEEETTWYEAQEICRVAGGHLAQIDSAEENAFIERTMNPLKRVWIGLHDHVKEMNFVWIETHQKPKYTNWFSGEPNSYAGNSEDCVEMWGSSEWNDSPCTLAFSSVCEMP